MIIFIQLIATMKKVILLSIGILLSSVSWSQSFQGVLHYEQEIGGLKSPVSIVVGAGKAIIERKESVSIQYTSSVAGTLDVRVDGGPAVEVALPELDAASQMKFGSASKTIGGFACRSVSQNLNGGSTLEGWFTESISVDWNRLIRAVQGQEWGQISGPGAMVEWEVKGSKGDVLLRGKLTRLESDGLR